MLYDYLKHAIFDVPFLRDKVIGEPYKTYVDFKDGSWIKALPLSRKQAFGKHVDLLIIDEATLIPKDMILDSFPLVKSRKGRIVIGSTPELRGDGIQFFLELWENPSKYKFIKYDPWNSYQCHWIDVEDAKSDEKWMSRHEYQIKHLGRPYYGLGEVFPFEDLKRCITDKDVKYQSGVKTYLGIDWGYGHPTVLLVVQRRGDMTYVLHIETYSQESFEFIHKRIDAICYTYNVDMIFVDINKGENRRLKDRGLPVTEVPFKDRRMLLQENVRNLVEKHRIVIPRKFVNLTQEMIPYKYNTKVNDDHVDALMLACSKTIIDKPGSKYHDYFKVITV